MSTYRPPRRTPGRILAGGTLSPAKRLRRAAMPVVDAALGDAQRRAQVERALTKLPLRRAPRPDLVGWSTEEYLAYHAGGPNGPLPPRRAGRGSAGLANRLAGTLPAGAVAMARGITDAAPPAGARVTPALRDVLETYLPETLLAFNAAAPRELRGQAEHLLLSQLTLLQEATATLARADADLNDRDLQVQAEFLRQRFAELRPSGLDLSSTARPLPPPGAVPAEPPVFAARGPALSVLRGRAHVSAEREPVVLFGRQGEPHLDLRLALPKGRIVTLGVVRESAYGVASFAHASSRRFLTPRRVTGFRSPQVDVNLRVHLMDTARFLVYVLSVQPGEPTPTVLFVSEGPRAQADLPTLLTHDRRAALTVVASGYAMAQGTLVRNESLLYPDLRAACTGFGYGRVEWLDRHTPIV